MPVDVSVVVPVYNAGDYIRECMESLLSQTLRNAEYIFVDDGSEDNSVDIIREYMANDKRIVLLRQKNQYAGIARNNGLDRATGKYIIFLDSDDFFDLNMLKAMFDAAERSQAEIVVCKYFEYDTIKKRSTGCSLEFREGVVSPRELGCDIFNKTIAAPWNKLILRQYVLDTGVRFQALERSNDIFFCNIIVASARRIYLLDKKYVYYRVNNNNSLQGSFSEGSLCFKQAISQIRDVLIAKGLFSNDIQNAYYDEAAQVLFSYMNKPSNVIDKKRVYTYCKDLLYELFTSDEVNIIVSKRPFLTPLCESTSFSEYLFFENHSLKERYEAQINSIMNSKTYRAGAFVFSFPQLIIKIIDHLKKTFKSMH